MSHALLRSVKNERSNKKVPRAATITKIDCPKDQVYIHSFKSSARVRLIDSRK